MTVATKEMLQSIWKGVNPVQLGLSTTFDLFYTLSIILFSMEIFEHPRFGKVFGWFGLVAATMLLLFNLYSFPEPPADIGLIDLGPLVSLWLAAVAVQMLHSQRDMT